MILLLLVAFFSYIPFLFLIAIFFYCFFLGAFVPHLPFFCSLPPPFFWHNHFSLSGIFCIQSLAKPSSQIIARTGWFWDIETGR